MKTTVSIEWKVMLYSGFIWESILRCFAFSLKGQLIHLKEELQQRIEKRKNKLKEMRSSLKVFQVRTVMYFKGGILGLNLQFLRQT